MLQVWHPSLELPAIGDWMRINLFGWTTRRKVENWLASEPLFFPVTYCVNSAMAYGDTKNRKDCQMLPNNKSKMFFAENKKKWLKKGIKKKLQKTYHTQAER